MKNLLRAGWALRLTGVALVAMFCIGRVEPQDPNAEATYGSVKLRAGFTPDPYTKKLTAGGPILTDKGGVNAHIAKAPDFKLFYTAGNFALTIRATSEADTTLLVNLPSGKFVADDDSGGNLNPRLRFPTPQSGRYDIWVGTLGKNTAPATLIITELK